MNITTIQLHALRRLLTKEDRTGIAEQLCMSGRTVEAVLNGTRTNDEIERAVVREVRQKVAHMARVLAAIDLRNVLPVTVAELTAHRNSPAWQSDDYYPRYNDVYLRLCSNRWEMAELWEVLQRSYKDVLLHGVYCCDLLCRLVGITDKESVSYYNDNIKY